MCIAKVSSSISRRRRSIAILAVLTMVVGTPDRVFGSEDLCWASKAGCATDGCATEGIYADGCFADGCGEPMFGCIPSLTSNSLFDTCSDARNSVADSGVTFNANIAQFYMGVVSGGIDQLFSEGVVLVPELRIPTSFFDLPGHQLIGPTGIGNHRRDSIENLFRRVH